LNISIASELEWSTGKLPAKRSVWAIIGVLVSTAATAVKITCLIGLSLTWAQLSCAPVRDKRWHRREQRIFYFLFYTMRHFHGGLSGGAGGAGWRGRPQPVTAVLTPSVISRLTGEWQKEYGRWQRRDLSARRLVVRPLTRTDRVRGLT
jgi:hypothetical protein